jgi:polysaccharide export outer membrane protein
MMTSLEERTVRLHQHGKGSRRATLTGALALAVALGVSGCGSTGPFVWVNQYQDPRPPAPANSYVLGPGDMVNVSVYNQEGMSARARIRTDGKISLPFLNDVKAEGFTPNDLAEQLSVRLKDYVNKPVVTVSVEEQRQLKIVVVGEVARPGIIDLPADVGLLQALATAGGLTETASSDEIFVIRYDPTPVRIRFRYKTLLRAESPDATFKLRAGDQILVQ